MKDWQKEIGDFFDLVVKPAIVELGKVVEKSGRDVETSVGEDSASLIASSRGEEEFSYKIRVRIYPTQKKYPSGLAYPYATRSTRHRTISTRATIKEMQLKPVKRGEKLYSISDISKDDIIKHFMRTFRFQLRNILD